MITVKNIGINLKNGLNIFTKSGKINFNLKNREMELNKINFYHRTENFVTLGTIDNLKIKIERWNKSLIEINGFNTTIREICNNKTRKYESCKISCGHKCKIISERNFPILKEFSGFKLKNGLIEYVKLNKVVHYTNIITAKSSDHFFSNLFVTLLHLDEFDGIISNIPLKLKSKRFNFNCNVRHGIIETKNFSINLINKKEDKSKIKGNLRVNIFYTIKEGLTKNNIPQENQILLNLFSTFKFSEVFHPGLNGYFNKSPFYSLIKDNFLGRKINKISNFKLDHNFQEQIMYRSFNHVISEFIGSAYERSASKFKEIFNWGLLIN